MDFVSFGLTQTCTVWAKTGVNGYNEPTFATPIQRACRWEERTTKIQNTLGEEVLSRARVFLDEDLNVGDYVAFGTVAGADPRNVAGAYEVIDFRKIPSLDGTFFERKCYL